MLRLLFFGAAPTIVFGNPSITIGADGVLHASYRSLYAINSDGSAKWSLDADANGILEHVEGPNSTVYVTVGGPTCGEPAALLAVDGLDGRIRWKHQVGGNRELERYNHPPIVDADGTIYLTTRSGGRTPFCNSTTFEAIDPAGALKWNFTVDGCGSLSVVDGPFYRPDIATVFAESSKSLEALWPHSGDLKWSVALDDSAHFTVFDADGNAYLMQGDDNQKIVSSLSNEDGRVLWSYPFTPWAYDQAAYTWMTMNSRHDLYVSGAASTETGDTTVDCHSQECVCTILVFDFHGNYNRNIPCFGVAHSMFHPQYDDESDAFVTTSLGNVWAHSGEFGQLLWNVSVSNSSSLYGRTYFGRGGTVFVWRSDGVYSRAYALQDGRVAWSVETGGASQPIISEDGTTYVQGWTCQKDISLPDCGAELEIVAVGAVGEEKWRYTPAEAAAMLV